jgi:hypothetical protein
VVVPGTDTEPAPEKPTTSGPPLFERSDFDDVFSIPDAGQQAGTVAAAASAGTGAARSPAPPAGAWGTFAEPPFDVERVEVPAGTARPSSIPPPPPQGFFLSPARATLLTVVAIVALAVAFGAGLLVGYLIRSAPQPEASATSQR